MDTAVTCDMLHVARDTSLQPRRDSTGEGQGGAAARAQVTSLPLFQRGDSMPVLQRDCSSVVSEATTDNGGANAGNVRAMESLLEIMNEKGKEGEAASEKSAKMTRSDFVTIRPIAKGAFGCVYLVKRKSDGLLYVQRAAASRHTHCSISCVCLEGGGSDAAAAGTP